MITKTFKITIATDTEEQMRKEEEHLSMIYGAEEVDPEETKWISVSERLPEDEYVLISKIPSKISGSKWSVTIAIRTINPNSRKIQWRDIGFGIIQDNEVLAWIPLPKPYKPGSEE